MAPLPPPALPFPKGEGSSEQEEQLQQHPQGRHHNNNTATTPSSSSSESASASASASSESESSSSPPPPAPAGAPFSVSASSAAPPLLASSSCLPTIPSQQHPLLHFQNQFQQQPRLLSLHLSTSTSPSPSSPPPPPPPPSHLNPKPLSALPPLLPPPSSFPASDPSPVVLPTLAPTPAPHQHSRDDCWSEGATLTLIQAWGDRYLELNRGNLKQKHWKDVADCVNRRANGSKASKTDVQCKNRLDTLKKKYKLEKSKIVTGGGPSKWAFFERLDDLIGPNKKPTANISKKPTTTTPTTTTTPPIPTPTPMLAHSSIPSICTTSIYPHISTPIAVPLTCDNSTVPVNATITTTTTGNNNNINNSTNKFLSAPAAPSTLACNKRPFDEIDLKQKPSLFPPFPHIPSTIDTVSKSKESPDMADSCPNGLHHNPSDGKVSKRKKSEDNPFQELARAILKFGEVYERIETAKQQQLIDLEKQRMEFTKDLELQRLQLFMQTQVELAKLKHGHKHDNTDHYL